MFYFLTILPIYIILKIPIFVLWAKNINHMTLFDRLLYRNPHVFLYYSYKSHILIFIEYMLNKNTKTFPKIYI